MDVEKKISKLQKFGIKLGLERIEKLTDLLDRPQDGMDYIHIGGTNGKGSVSNYIYSVLKHNGYRVGMFTSPFMEGFRHAIVVNDVCMTDEEMELHYSKIQSAMTAMEDEGLELPTEFEVITTLALLYFKDKLPDFVIMEVGLGGIGDSTNIIGSPLLSVITSVALDHCDVLGHTIPEIAREKSGIIKENTPVVSNVSNPDGAKVIAQEAYGKKAPLINASKYKAVITESKPSGSKFSVNIDGINYPHMEISMGGEHQVRNAVCALAAIEQLRKKAKISLDREVTLAGLKNAGLSGRFEIIPGNPPIIMDGAHNEEGATALKATISKFYPGKKILTVFSLMKDKRSDEVICEFLDFSNAMVIADILDDKPINSGELASLVGEMPFKIIHKKDELINTIKSVNGYDIILVTGSLYLIREIREDLIALG